MDDSGWSNSGIFWRIISSSISLVGLVLLTLYGLRSRISVEVVDWAKDIKTVLYTPCTYQQPTPNPQSSLLHAEMSEKQPITSQPENNHQTMGGYDQPPGSDYPLASTGDNQNNSHFRRDTRRDSARLLVPLDGNRDWSTSLFDCAQDPWNCLCVFFCTPCAMCQLASSMGECTFMPMCVPAATITMRTRLRTLGGIRGSICNDCLLTSVCGLCTLCQMKREMDIMGLVA